MKKAKTEDKKIVGSEEYTPEEEGRVRAKEEFSMFLNSAKLYLGDTVRIYKGFFKRLCERLSGMMTEELGAEDLPYRRRAAIFLFGILFTVVGVFISATPIASAYPVALALISSAGVNITGKNLGAPRITMVLALVSVILSTLMMGGAGLLYFTVIITVFIMRSVVTRGEFDESTVFRTLTSFGAAVVLSSFELIINSFSFDSIGTGLTLAVATPLFTYIFSGLFASVGTLETGLRMKAEVGLATIAFLVALALSKVAVFGFSLAAVFGFCIALTVGKVLGPMRAGVFGLITGMGAGGGVFAAAFGVGAVLSSAFFTVSDLLSISVAVVVASSVSLYVGGVEGLLLVLPEVLFASLILYPVLKLLPVSAERIKLLSDKIKSSDEHERESVKRKLERMSGTFATLSEVFYAVTDTLKTPSVEDVKKSVDNAMNRICATCSMSGACWSKYYGDSCDTRNKLAHALYNTGRISSEDFPLFFADRCIKVDELIDRVNKNFSAFQADANDMSRAGLIAGEYRTVSKLLRNTAESFESSERENLLLAERAGSIMKALGIPFSRIEAWGERKSVIDVFGIQEERLDRSAGDILAAFESECGMCFEEPEFIRLESTTVMRLKRRAPITLECAKKSCSKKGESLNGDTVSFFESENGYFYALVSDGMGSGRDAALTSRLASIFLEKLLTCTDDKKTTLEMLNTLLMTKKDECFTTLDLIEFDLLEMKASFLKAGAAPSYIVREDKLYKVNSETPPAGIIPRLSAEETKVTVKDGDVLVMLSDGITDAGELGTETPWLAELLDGERGRSAEALAERILSEALTRFSAKDDMSVAVISVKKD